MIPLARVVEKIKGKITPSPKCDFHLGEGVRGVRALSSLGLILFSSKNHPLDDRTNVLNMR
jgi:hypothetical protein